MQSGTIEYIRQSYEDVYMCKENINSISIPIQEVWRVIQFNNMDVVNMIFSSPYVAWVATALSLASTYLTGEYIFKGGFNFIA